MRLSTLLFALLAVIAVPAFAASTTYTASTGITQSTMVTTMHFDVGGHAVAAPNLPPSLCYFPGPCDFTGSTFSYVPADGTSAVFQNFSGTFHSVSSSVYEIDGTASGTDSTGATVSVVVVYQFRAWCRAGRGGGCYKKYLSGSMTVNP